MSCAIFDEKNRRVCELNRQEPNPDGQYVLYAMSNAFRTRHNHALELAIKLANRFGKPLLVAVLYRPACHNVPQWVFLLSSFHALSRNLTRRNLSPIFLHSASPLVEDDLLSISSKSTQVILDTDYLRDGRRWQRALADRLVASRIRVVRVEGNLVLPVEIVSSYSEMGARTIRPKIWQQFDAYCHLPADEGDVKAKSDWKKLLREGDFRALAIDDELAKATSVVNRVSPLLGGEENAESMLRRFIDSRLAHYGAERNIVGSNWQSDLSPYLHFGMISPIHVIQSVRAVKGHKDSQDSFIEELLVRRELSYNFVWYEPSTYDSLRCLPDWATKTLREHADDKREPAYDMQQLADARSHDVYWNAAQMELTFAHKMHGYMRMYWAKKVLEWSPTVEAAYAFLIEQNDKWSLDGCEPNGFAGVIWCFGKHDRAHAERAVFGKVRYMCADGLKRKFRASLGDYVKKCYAMAGRKVPVEEPKALKRKRK